MVFGDGLNDLELFDYAGINIAIEEFLILNQEKAIILQKQ